MAKRIELFDITLSKDGTRMVAKLNAESLTAVNYKGESIKLEKGDYLDVASLDDVRESLDFLLKNEYIDQGIYDKKADYLNMVSESFRARVSVRAKK